MEELSTLHPAAQVAMIITIGAIICVGIWQVMKTLRSM